MVLKNILYKYHIPLVYCSTVFNKLKGTVNRIMFQRRMQINRARFLQGLR